MTMPSRLPPRASLRAFEAASRHLSFAKAADDLLVTPGAISQQVKQLEDWLGVPLFRRLPKGVLLTDAGQLYGSELREVFARLAAASERVRRHAGSPILTASMSPSFAARWLIPRLGEFRARHPDIDVRVDVNQGPTDFARENVDVAIRHGPGPSCMPSCSSRTSSSRSAARACSRARRRSACPPTSRTSRCCTRTPGSMRSAGCTT